MDFRGIVAALKARFPEADAPAVSAGDPFVVVPAAKSREVLRHLRTDPVLSFDSLVCLTGVDTGRELWVVYHLHSFQQRHRLTVKVILPRDRPELETASTLWPAAEFLEREVFDLYGIRFLNHPDLRRLLNPPDWEGWPGRKDYVFPKEYHGVALAREGQLFAADMTALTAAREAREKPAPPARKDGGT